MPSELGGAITAHLESGCALIIGVALADGRPFATRGWGLDVLGDGQVRLLLSSLDVELLDHLEPGLRIAITSADVPTLHSIQLKGRVREIEPGTDRDRERAARFCDAFYRDIHDTEGTDLRLLRRLTPVDYVVCIVDVDDMFDQTPGPTAGSPVTEST